MPEFLYLFRNSTTAPVPSPEAMQRSMQKWIAWIDQLSGLERSRVVTRSRTGARSSQGPAGRW